MTIKQLFNNTRKYGPAYVKVLTFYKFGLSDADSISRCVEPFYLHLTEDEREKELKDWFFDCMGYSLNLEDPHTFSEKIQWLKLYHSTPEKTRLADKIQVRDWITEEIGSEYLVPLLGFWDCFDDIDFSVLPKSFVLKASHGSAMNIIVKDHDDFNKKIAKRKIDGWMKTDYGINQTQQWHYLGISHRVMAEQFLETANGDLPDYKVYCFGGVPTYIQVITGRNSDERQIFMDTEWNPMTFGHTGIDMMQEVPSRPKQLNKVLRLSKTLASGFPFVRVDWYIIDDDDEIYFGEMTFTPASGVRKWFPDGTDEMLGDLIELPKEKYILPSK